MILWPYIMASVSGGGDTLPVRPASLARGLENTTGSCQTLWIHAGLIDIMKVNSFAPEVPLYSLNQSYTS